MQSSRALRQFFLVSSTALGTLLAIGAGCSGGDSGSGTTLTGGSGGSTAGSGGRGAGGSAGSSSGGSAGDAGSSGAAGSSGSSDGGAAGESGGSGGTGGSAGGGPTQCTNGLDDDGDGQIDGMDAECTGPSDDDEGSFDTGIPGDNKDPKWQDCFFDGNSGAGDDDCRYATGCLTGELESTDPDCEVSEACLKYCGSRTPNGCDCFGCCEISLEDGSTVDVILAGTCSLETVEDETVCPRCVQDDDCGNDCGHCELCPGKTEIPDDCGDGGEGGSGSGGAGGSGGNGGNGGGAGGSSGSGTGGSGGDGHTCDNGEIVCDSAADCPAGNFCQLGCCLVVG